MKLRDVDLVLVDAMNTLWRAAHATGRLGYDSSEGFRQTGAVFGFLRAVEAVIRRTPRAEVVVVWEGGRGERQSILPEYKARRQERDPKQQELYDLVTAQIDILRDLLAHTSWGQLRAPGHEADDAIVTAARTASVKLRQRVLIYSNDADVLQALAPRVAVYKATKKADVSPLWTVGRLSAEWGVAPWQVPHVKALSGDTSDGYKGAKGIGEVWARKFIAEHGTVDGVIAAAAAGELPAAKAKALSEERNASELDSPAEYVRKCFQVAELRDDVDTVLEWGDPSPHKLERVFRELRFASLSTTRFTR